MERIVYPELKSAAIARAATAEGKLIQYENEFRKLLTAIQEEIDRACLLGFSQAYVLINQKDYRFLDVTEKYIQDYIREMGYLVCLDPDDELRDVSYFDIRWDNEGEKD